MDILVCVKRVPDTSEADVIVAKDGRSIEEKGLVFDINEWDKYAVEEAVCLKEKLGGTVTVLTLGTQESEDTLRRSLATGADKALRLSDAAFAGSDAATTARILCSAVKGLNYDLILTGAQASDDANGQVGPALAELLKIPHATLVTSLEIVDSRKARVHRELEGGLEEVLEVQLPALFTIQTGINEPRYVSIMGIRKASKQEIKTTGLAELGLPLNEVGEASARVRVERLCLPSATKQTELIAGTLEEVATKLAGIIKDKGGLS